MKFLLRNLWTDSELLVDLLIELGWLLGDTLLSASKGLRGNLQARVHEPHAGRTDQRNLR